MSVFSERLRSTMKKQKISQAKLAEITGIPKSAISQYLSDKFKPRQERTYLISRALGVSPAWLSGYDGGDKIDSAKKITLSETEFAIVKAYRASKSFKKAVDTALSHANSTFDVFRAAKSEDGTVAPSSVEMTAERLERLANAPQTNEDL